MKPQHLDFTSQRLMLFVMLLPITGCGDTKDPWQPDTVSPLKDQGVEAVRMDLPGNADPDQAQDALLDALLDSQGSDDAEAGLIDLAQNDSAPDLTSADQTIATPDLAGDVGPLSLNSSCGSPEPLILTNGIASTSGTTQSSINEFNAIDCGGALMDTMSGPQVYYRVFLEGGKKYKVTALSQSTSFDLALYTFPAGTACTASDIDAGCTSPVSGGLDNVYASDKLGSARAEVVRIAPLVDEEWIIAVDAYSSNDQGPFSLAVTEIVAAANATCAQPTPLPLVSGQASAAGNTDGATNEFGSSITCGSGASLAGAQVYFSLSVAAGKGYRVTLKPSFFSTVYTFPGTANCVGSEVELGCSSGGQSGTLLGSVAAGFSNTFVFVPDLPGDYVIAVDTMDPQESGAFELEVEEYDPPAHGKCAAPEPLILTASPLTRSDDTTGAANQFGQSITCNTVFNFSGAQLYYGLTLEGGTTYTIEVTPVGWDVALYLFTDATCVPTEIEAQCSTAGFAVDANTTGAKETLVVTPTDTASYILAVDTYSPTEAGALELNISW